MSNIKRFDDFVGAGVLIKVEKMILENAVDFIDRSGITDSEISDFRQRQEEILQKYPSLSDLDRDNITNRMNSIINDEAGAGDTGESL